MKQRMRLFQGNRERRTTAKECRRVHVLFLAVMFLAAMALALALSVAATAQQSQSNNDSNPSQPSAKPKPDQDVPDAPSAVQPPEPKPGFPEPPVGPVAPALKPDPSQQSDQEKQPPPPMPPIQTIAPGTGPRNQVNPKEDLGFKIRYEVHFVLLPVMVKDSSGRRVDGLLPKDFTVLENGKKQTLKFFTSDPFQLSVAIVLDTGMADVTLQKVNQTYEALVGAFSPYDEVALYTYSSTVTQQTDYTNKSQRLIAELNQIKEIRGAPNGPPVLGGPLAGGPTVNGAPPGGPVIAPVNTPPKEDHVLNDAILRAALDLSRRDRTRRKVIFVISDGRERGSSASYKQVLKLLETRDIQVKAVVLDSGALPAYKEVNRFHLPFQGYSDILPKYVSATGGGQVYTELTRNALEEMYGEITNEARNQYTLGYTPEIVSTKAYRSIDVLVDKKGLKIYAKDGYYPIPTTPSGPPPPRPQPVPQ